MVAPGAWPKGGEGPAGRLLPRGLRFPAQGSLEGRSLGPELYRGAGPEQGRGLLTGAGSREGRNQHQKEARRGLWGISVSQNPESAPGFAPPCRGYAHIPPSSPMTSRPRYQGTS